MELTPRQLAKVKIYVAGECKYPDMQLAITNHIKYRIQDLMTDDPDLHLDDAIAIAQKEFGANSFKIFEKSIRASSKIKYGKLFWQTLPTNFKLKYIVVGAVAMLWVYLLFVDVHPPINSVVVCLWSGSVVFYPLLILTGSMRFKSARPYKWYYTLAESNIILYPWCLFLGVFMMLAGYLAQFFVGDGNFTWAGLIAGFTLTFALLMLRTAYTIRKAALNDCREIELQLDEIHA